MKHELVILLGTNQGNRVQYLQKAIDLLKGQFGDFVSQSSIYETDAWGGVAQQSFLNQIVIFEVEGCPATMLKICLSIEHKLGRERFEKWGDRCIDIDILFYGKSIIKTPDFSLPHPRMQDRKFTLVPLAELRPNLLHPTFNKSILCLLEECPDALEVRMISDLKEEKNA